MSDFRRRQFDALKSRLEEPRRFLQVVTGARQVGKTTLVRQVLAELGSTPSIYASADGPFLEGASWIDQQWERGRLALRDTGGAARAVLVLDEIQKIDGWSESVKRLWDEDTRQRRALHVVILGSSALLVERGLSESLAGRFEVIRVPHWSFGEMSAAFGWDVERYVYYGGYPGAAGLVEDRERWARYILDSLIETSVSRDILLMTRVDKPVLLRRLFEIGCRYSAQIVSFQKMLGQLHDAGNTTTLAHYLELLCGAGLLAGIPKYAGIVIRQRGSSPKLMVLNTALMTAPSAIDFGAARGTPDFWGRLVESAIGSHLLNSCVGTDVRVSYWRERNREVDFVLERARAAVAIEVRTGRHRESQPGLDTFERVVGRRVRKLLVGGPDGIGVAEFLSRPAAEWIAGGSAG